MILNLISSNYVIKKLKLKDKKNDEKKRLGSIILFI